MQLGVASSAFCRQNRGVALRDDQTVEVKPDVLSRVLDGEAVLLDLASGTYFGLNQVGTEVWSLIASSNDVAAITAGLLEVFEVDEQTARRDLEVLLVELHDRGLVELGA